MADRVIGDRVEKTPRRELDRTDLDGVLVGGVLTDARAPVRDGGVLQRSQAATGGGGGAASSLRILEADADPDVSNVRVILVPNDHLTDNGAGNVSLDIPPRLTLQNATVVNTNTKTINVPDGSLSVGGGGEMTIIERHPIPIKITAVGGTDANDNDLYDIVELDGEGNELETTRNNVPNLGRPAATLSVDDQAEMGYSPESDSFFFSEAT